MKVGDTVKVKYHGKGTIKAIHDDGSVSVVTQQVMMGRHCVYRYSKKDVSVDTTAQATG